MIYFIQETGLFKSKVKIGYSQNVQRRMMSFRSANSTRLRLLLVLPGDQVVESLYHEKFKKYRVHGEWFRYGWKLRVFVFLNWFRPILFDSSSDEMSQNFVYKEPIEIQNLTDEEVKDHIVNAYTDGESLNGCCRLYHSLSTGEEWPRGKRLGSQHTRFITSIVESKASIDILAEES